jgi:hypothetical protein
MPAHSDLSIEDREALVKRWLRLTVERSTLDDLSARPLAERIREFELLLEAAGETGIAIAAAGEASGDQLPGDDLTSELDRRVAEHRADGTPFSLALLAGGEDWRGALRRAGDGEPVHVAAGGVTAIVLPGLAGVDARAAVDRLRVAAWRELGGEGRLAEVGVASFPLEGETAIDLVAAAQAQLTRVTSSDRREDRIERAIGEHHERMENRGSGAPATAVVTPLPLPSSRLEPEWGPWAPRS